MCFSDVPWFSFYSIGTGWTAYSMDGEFLTYYVDMAFCQEKRCLQYIVDVSNHAYTCKTA